MSATSRSTGKACKKRSSFRCAKLRSRRSVLISQSAVYRRIHTTQHKLAQRSAATVSGDVVIDTVAASEHLARRSTGTRLAPRVYSALSALHSAVCDRCSAARESGERSRRDFTAHGHLGYNSYNHCTSTMLVPIHLVRARRLYRAGGALHPFSARYLQYAKYAKYTTRPYHT